MTKPTHEELKSKVAEAIHNLCNGVSEYCARTTASHIAEEFTAYTDKLEAVLKELKAELKELEETAAFTGKRLANALAENAILREALEEIAGHGVSQSAAMNMPEVQWAWRCFNNLQRIARQALKQGGK